jgi:Ca2+-binding RTX toxin-like protein
MSITISEILFNPPGSDSPNEYIELKGTPGSTIANGTYLLGIEGDAGTPNPGDIQNIINLSGRTFGSNGLLVLRQRNSTYTVNANARNITNTGTGTGWGSGATSNIGHSADGGVVEVEDSSVTFMLIQSSTAPTLSTDIDSNNDGIADGAVFSSWTVLDSVSILDGGTNDTAYGNHVFRFGTSGGLFSTSATVENLTFIPEYVARVNPWVAGTLSGTSSAWTINNTSNSNFMPTGSNLNSQIGAINDFVVPIIDLNGAASGTAWNATYSRGGGAVSVVDAANLTVGNDRFLTGATVTITNLQDGNLETLSAVTTGTSISASYSNGVLSLTGSDTVANYQQVLRSIAYNNTAFVPNATTRNVEFAVTDGNSTSVAASATVAINSIIPIAIGNITGTTDRRLDNLSDSNPEDIYSFSLAGNNNRLIAHLVNGTGGNIDIGIYDASSNLIAAGTNFQTSEYFDIAGLASGTYFLRTYLTTASSNPIGYRTTLRSGNAISGTSDSDNLSGTTIADWMDGFAGNDTISGGDGDDVISGGEGNDILIGDAGNDHIQGDLGNDELRGGAGADVLTGDKLAVPEADTFIFATASDSLLNGYDRIIDFNGSAGDRIKLLFGNPTGFFNAGINANAGIAGLQQDAILAAFVDKDFVTAGTQPLGANEAVFIRFNSSIANGILVVNDSNSGFSATSDLVVEAALNIGDVSTGTLTVSNYFV